MLWLSRVKGLLKELSQDLCDFWLGHWHWQCFSFSLDNNNGRKPAICNRLQPQKHVDSFASKAAEHDPPSPLSFSCSFSFIYGCNYRLDLQLFYVRQNTSLNLYDKFPVQSANQTRWMSHCLPLSLLFSLSPSPISLYHCLTVHHERILSNNNRSMSIIIIL